MATGKDQEAPSLLSLRQEARAIYGNDAPGYDAGRPDYPAEVYEILAARCGLRAGASVVEIGPGTGLVTRRLVAADARVVAVEPDQNMAAHLAAAVSSDVEIIPRTFDQAPLPHDRFDLAVAATSFHWVDQGAVNPVVSAADFANRGRECPLRMTQRHEQPVTDGTAKRK